MFVHIILRGEGGRIYPLVELLPSIENTCFTHYITINGVYIHTPLGVLLPGVETTRFTHHITRREGGGRSIYIPPGVYCYLVKKLLDLLIILLDGSGGGNNRHTLLGVLLPSVETTGFTHHIT